MARAFYFVKNNNRCSATSVSRFLFLLRRKISFYYLIIFLKKKKKKKRVISASSRRCSSPERVRDVVASEVSTVFVVSSSRVEWRVFDSTVAIIQFPSCRGLYFVTSESRRELACACWGSRFGWILASTIYTDTAFRPSVFASVSSGWNCPRRLSCRTDTCEQTFYRLLNIVFASLR